MSLVILIRSNGNLFGTLLGEITLVFNKIECPRGMIYLSLTPAPFDICFLPVGIKPTL